MELLRSLEQIVTQNGLVEFRPRIDALASRLEDDSFEVALFRRVSCGKSSLLNAILGTAVLPVGVNPITAVPTKLRYGATLRAAASYGDGRSSALSIEQLSQLVTEQGNPGNLKNVVRVVVEVPSQRLKSGILLVDTPGLGSLARRGAAETLAYLPSCDLGLLLIDAGAPLNEEEIGTLRLLYAAGIPALVLLSKSDLLRNDDLRQAASYMHEHVQSELGLQLQPDTAAELESLLRVVMGEVGEEIDSLQRIAENIGRNGMPSQERC
jgi:GTP-binding protein EngB required for normal cell division